MATHYRTTLLMMAAAIAGSYSFTGGSMDTGRAQVMLSESLREAYSIPTSLGSLPREFAAAKTEFERLVIVGKASFSSSLHEMKQRWKAR